MEDVVIAIVQRNGLFVMLQRHDGSWTFPSGKVEENEDMISAVIRETQEETGLNIDHIEYLGERIIQQRNLFYFSADAVAGDLANNEPDHFCFAEWKMPQDILEMVGENLFPPVGVLLNKYINMNVSIEK